MKNLLILGAGGFGREVLGWASKNAGYNTNFTIGGFLDDNPEALKGYSYPVEVIGSIQDYHPTPADLLVCAIGNPQAKQRIVELMLQRGGRFMNLIHPTAVLGTNVTLGQGVIICPSVVISADVTVGNFVSIDTQSVLGHDVQVGHYSHVAIFSALTGHAKLQERVFIGCNSTLLPGVTIGADAIVGAGSVVTKPVDAGLVVAGVPARPLKKK